MIIKEYWRYLERKNKIKNINKQIILIEISQIYPQKKIIEEIFLKNIKKEIYYQFIQTYKNINNKIFEKTFPNVKI